jgi:integral membrane protein
VVMKYLHRDEEERKSNADALEGRVGVVIEDVQPQHSGYVKVDGDEWRAVSADGSLIKIGEKVRIVKMESIIATVERV